MSSRYYVTGPDRGHWRRYSVVEGVWTDGRKTPLATLAPRKVRYQTVRRFWTFGAASKFSHRLNRQAGNTR